MAENFRTGEIIAPEVLGRVLFPFCFCFCFFALKNRISQHFPKENTFLEKFVECSFQLAFLRGRICSLTLGIHEDQFLLADEDISLDRLQISEGA